MSSPSEHLGGIVSHDVFFAPEELEELQANMRRFDYVITHQKVALDSDIENHLQSGVPTFYELVCNYGGYIIQGLHWDKNNGYHISDYTEGIYQLTPIERSFLKYIKKSIGGIIYNTTLKRFTEISGKVTEIVAPKKLIREKLSLEEAEELVPGIQSQIRSLLGVIDFSGFEEVEKNIKEILHKEDLKTSDVDVSGLETDGSFKIPEGATLQELLLVFGLHLACNPERITKANARRSLGYG